RWASLSASACFFFASSIFNGDHVIGQKNIMRKPSIYYKYVFLTGGYGVKVRTIILLLFENIAKTNFILEQRVLITQDGYLYLPTDGLKNIYIFIIEMTLICRKGY
ncbi:hypothetical protein ACJX0J_015932, partial [Zea mays]